MTIDEGGDGDVDAAFGGKVLKDRRSPRRRGRMGTSVTENAAAARSIERSTCATTTGRGRLLGGSATYARTPIESIDASVAVSRRRPIRQRGGLSARVVRRARV
jgi:hypothetical protein